jgi:DNA-binding NarL/FixJ family response regulator
LLVLLGFQLSKSKSFKQSRNEIHLVLPKKPGDIFWNELKAFEQEKNMTFVTSVERIGIKKGREEERQKIVLSMLKKGVSVEDIAEFTKLLTEQVKEIQFQTSNL